MTAQCDSEMDTVFYLLYDFVSISYYAKLKVGQLLNEELERTWKYVICFGIFLEELRKSWKKVGRIVGVPADILSTSTSQKHYQ